MNCTNHPEIPNVAICNNCGRGLCKTCSDKYSVPTCDNCLIEQLKIDKKKIKREFILMIIVGFVFARMAHIDESNFYSYYFGPLYSVIAFYYGISLVAGFNFLREKLGVTLVIGNIFIILGLLIGTIFIGLFVAPSRIIKNFKKLKLIKQVTF